MQIIILLAFSLCAAANLEIPAYIDTSAIVIHTGFTLEYAEKYEQAKWVAYMLTKDRANGTLDRTGSFRSDPLVPTGSAKTSDYTNSGYDRGHLAPAADMEWDSAALYDCFYMSNMSPQLHSFNAGIWETLESQARKWAIQNDTEYIVAGGILHDGLPTIGTDNVAVPEYFFKVVLVYSANEKKGIGFILKNESSQNQLESFAISIDSVEKVTGIDFFPSLPDSIETRIESQIDISKWSFPTDGIKQPHFNNHISHPKTSSKKGTLLFNISGQRLSSSASKLFIAYKSEQAFIK